jgi:hypothetical protein
VKLAFLRAALPAPPAAAARDEMSVRPFEYFIRDGATVGGAGVPAFRGADDEEGMATRITFQPTPNPNAGKFTADRTIVEASSSRSFFSAEQAAGDPAAAALFELDGVASVFMVADFVTVTKTPDTDWSDLIPRVIDTLERVLE